MLHPADLNGGLETNKASPWVHVPSRVFIGHDKQLEELVSIPVGNLLLVVLYIRPVQLPDVNKHFSVVFGVTVRLKWCQESASDLWQPRSNLDQKGCWRLIPVVLLSCCGPEWRRETVSRERWHRSAQLSPTALSNCPTGRRGQTTWNTQQRETQCNLQC